VRFVGWISLKHAGEAPDIEIGYRLMFHARGHGCATELARAMLRRGFDELRLPPIIRVTGEGNQRASAAHRRRTLPQRCPTIPSSHRLGRTNP